MENDSRGHQILEVAGLLRFASVSDPDYDAIREMERIGSNVDLMATVPPSASAESAAS
jgi:hypothetical protein